MYFAALPPIAAQRTATAAPTLEEWSPAPPERDRPKRWKSRPIARIIAARAAPTRAWRPSMSKMSTRRKLAIATWGNPGEGNIYGKLTLDATEALAYLD